MAGPALPVANYDPLGVKVTINNFLIVGFATDSIVSVKRDEQGYTKTVGADGQVVRTKNANRGGTITLELLPTSPSNNDLSLMAQNDEIDGTGVGSGQVSDALSTKTLAHAPNVWVQKLPDLERAKAIGKVTWVFDCDNVSIFIGGATQ